MDLLVDCSSLSEQRLDVVPNPHQQQLKSKSSSRKRKERNDKHSSDEDDDDTKKRHRRTAHQIERKFRCDVSTCGKAYGSEGALKMHVRLKHSECIASKPNTTEGTATSFYSTSAGPTQTTFSAPQTVVSSPTQLMPHVWTTTVYGDVLVPLVVEDVSPEGYQQPQIAHFYVTSPTSNPQDLEQSLLVDETDYNDFKDLKEKFCYIPLLKLNIGLWQAESQCCGDLVAKFSYKERCIIWEIFDVGSLLRTVISFDNLNGVGLEFHPDDTATLVIELQAPPTFFKGVLRPYESTLWTQISDFTEGMASTFRRHILHFSRRVLTDTIESIFQRDPRLQSLLLQGLPALKSPYFSQLEKTTNVTSPPPSSVAQKEAEISTWNRTSPTTLDNEEKEGDSSGQSSPIIITIESSDPIAIEEGSADSLEVVVDELSKCALQNLQSYPQFIDSSLAHSKEAFVLPCGHTQTISLRDLLLRESFCSTCQEGYYFSFCKKKPVSVHTSWHCLVCNTCRGENEWHCPQCAKCTTSPPSLWGNSVVCQKCCALRENNSVPQGLRRNYRRKRLSSTKSETTLLIKPQPNNTCFIKPQPNIAPRIVPVNKTQPTVAPSTTKSQQPATTIKSEIKSTNNTVIRLPSQKLSNSPANQNNTITLPTQIILNINTK